MSAKENKFKGFPIQVEVGGNIVAGFNTCSFEENSTNCANYPHWIDLIDGVMDKSWVGRFFNNNLPTRILMGENWIDSHMIFQQFTLKHPNEQMTLKDVFYCFSLGVELNSEV